MSSTQVAFSHSGSNSKRGIASGSSSVLGWRLWLKGRIFKNLQKFRYLHVEIPSSACKGVTSQNSSFFLCLWLLLGKTLKAFAINLSTVTRLYPSCRFETAVCVKKSWWAKICKANLLVIRKSISMTLSFKTWFRFILYYSQHINQILLVKRV